MEQRGCSPGAPRCSWRRCCSCAEVTPSAAAPPRPPGRYYFIFKSLFFFGSVYPLSFLLYSCFSLPSPPADVAAEGGGPPLRPPKTGRSALPCAPADGKHAHPPPFGAQSCPHPSPPRQPPPLTPAASTSRLPACPPTRVAGSRLPAAGAAPRLRPLPGWGGKGKVWASRGVGGRGRVAGLGLPTGLPTPRCSSPPLAALGWAGGKGGQELNLFRKITLGPPFLRLILSRVGFHRLVGSRVRPLGELRWDFLIAPSCQAARLRLERAWRGASLLFFSFYFSSFSPS